MYIKICAVIEVGPCATLEQGLRDKMGNSIFFDKRLASRLTARLPPRALGTAWPGT